MHTDVMRRGWVTYSLVAGLVGLLVVLGVFQYRWLRRISESQRHAVVLHHLVGLSVEEIAHELGAPVGTVKARLSRGRNALAEQLSSLSTDPTKEVRHGR